ncbi:NAD(+) diphosphatase [Azohydromonas aeria]|uniref:NAD(+) diphosphatase n=1 Tax=Azohydromonas aeria TaxID=2590212 RepID=UPI0012F92501|nr:NAD(+) diphosphatase [Azohydromonas aeria]
MPFVPAHQLPPEPTRLGWHFAFVGKDLLLPLREAPPLLAATPGFGDAASGRHYLGQLDGLDCWALLLPAVPAGWQALPLRAAMMQLPPAQSALAARAAQVLEWDRSHRFCGVCGSATLLQPQERSRLCPACGHAAYPRVSPAMMALVWRPGELLLARGPHFAPGMYSALAGFVEPGESLEDCVAREVAEEVGVRVTNLQYYGSQSWPFPHSLMLAFTAQWDGGEIVPQPGEIEHAAWYALDALPDIPPRFSIAGHLIRDLVARMQAGGVEAAQAGGPGCQA